MSGDFHELKAKIYNSDTVNLVNDLIYTGRGGRIARINGFLEGIPIDKDNITINGNNHIIDANGKVRIFNITGKNVTLKNIIFKNGYTDEYGGAIRNDKGQINIINCKFIGNNAKGNGNDISNTPESEIKIESCEFSKINSKYPIWNYGKIYILKCEEEKIKEYISRNYEIYRENDIPDNQQPPTGFNYEYPKTPSGDDDEESYITKQPFKAYNGNDSYIFISYKHNDYKKVYPVIKQLHEVGFNIWYDANLQRGKHFDNEIANKIEKSEVFITFITEEVIRCADDEEDYLIKELNAAVEIRKKRFPIFLDNVKLKGSFLLHYAGIQSIFKEDFKNNDQLFIETCINTLQYDFGFDLNNYKKRDK